MNPILKHAALILLLAFTGNLSCKMEMVQAIRKIILQNYLWTKVLGPDSTYHRGQLVNMLQQLGVEKIPATDFTAWSRKK